MKIISLNLNGIRSAVKKGVVGWLLKENPDIICLQELRATPDQFPKEWEALAHYHAYYFPAQKKGYSGVSILSKMKPTHVHYGLGWAPADEEGRYLQIDLDELSIASLYLPSGSSGEHRQTQKFIFMENFLKDLLRLQQSGQKIMLCGDWNIAHTVNDIKNWRSNQKNSGFLPEEREWLTKIFSQLGWVDMFRYLYPDKVQYSWWSQRGQAYLNDVGWRIDYHIVSSNLIPYLQSLEMPREPKFSDHAPLIARLF